MAAHGKQFYIFQHKACQHALLIFHKKSTPLSTNNVDVMVLQWPPCCWQHIAQATSTANECDAETETG